MYAVSVCALLPFPRRALVNWGKALVGRAELAADRGAASKLYNAAIDKFEAVLEEDPEMLVAKYRCALAMQVRVCLHFVVLCLFVVGLTNQTQLGSCWVVKSATN